MDNSNRSFSDNTENQDKITVNEIMAKIRKELARRQNSDGNSYREYSYHSSLSFHNTENIAFSQLKLPIISSYPNFFPNNNGEYNIRDLLIYHQEEFIKNAHIAVLGREADPVELEIFLKRLNKGMSKIEILGRMRYSPEGRKKSIKIHGLFARLSAHMIYKIPVFGYLCRLGISLLRLPRTLRGLIDFEHSSMYQDKILQLQLNQNFEAIESELFKLGEILVEQGKHLNKLIGRLDTSATNLNVKIDDLNNYVHQTIHVYDDRIDSIEESTHIGLKERDVQSDNRFNELGEKLNQWIETLKAIESKKAAKEDLLQLAEIKTGKDETEQMQQQINEIFAQIHDHKISILDQHRRLKLLLEEARKRLPKSITKKQLKEMVKEEDHLLDAMYVSLEDKFRGTREDIKILLKEYLPYIKKCKAGTAKAPILDIGCGRGEWLELCKNEGLKALGVDINMVMTAQCSELGLDVTQTDAIQFLKEQDSNKFGAITGFHFIEHIGHSERIALFDESLRTLKPGGIAIFETPNPENLTVGAFSFYLDPTHLKPLVPETMQFILEQRGFVDVTIKRLHKNKAYYHKKVDKAFKNRWFYSEMDYAVIGYKK